MKKVSLVLGTSAILAGSVLSTTSVVGAASASGNGDGIEVNGSADATTTAEFSVEAGKLSFDSAPDFNFGKHSILDILQGQLQQEDNVIADGHDDSHTTVDESNGKFQSTSTGTLQISDFRGAGSTWELNASISDFANQNGQGSAKGMISLPGLIDGATIGSDSTTVWDSTAAATNGQKVATADLTKGAVLSLSDANNIQAGKYSATINWTLQNTSVAPTKG